MEATIRGLGLGDITPIRQAEKNLENDMEIGIVWGCYGVLVGFGQKLCESP